MDLNMSHQFFHILNSQLHELGIDTTYIEGVHSPQIGDTLRILLPLTDEGHASIAEVMVTEFSDDLDLLHIYTTLVIELGENEPQLQKELIEWNLLCPLGAYGIYVDDDEQLPHQLYHKYTAPFPKDTPVDSLAEQTMTFLELIHEILSQRYPDYAGYAAE